MALRLADGLPSASLAQAANGIPVRIAVMCRLLGATLGP